MKQLNIGCVYPPLMGSKVSTKKGSSKKKPVAKRGQRTADGSLIMRESRQAVKRIEHLDASIIATRENMEKKIKELEKERKKARKRLENLQLECEHPRLAREKGEWICGVCLRPADVSLKK